MSYGTKNSVEKVARLLLAAVAAAITVYCLRDLRACRRWTSDRSQVERSRPLIVCE